MMRHFTIEVDTVPKGIWPALTLADARQFAHQNWGDVCLGSIAVQETVVQDRS